MGAILPDQIKCLQCCANLLLFKLKQSRGEVHEGQKPPDVNDAVTMAPSWQQQTVGLQQMWACVTLPTCMEHMQVAELSEIDKAVMGGRILQGKVGIQGS